jgi:hypothetical protein
MRAPTRPAAAAIAAGADTATTLERQPALSRWFWPAQCAAWSFYAVQQMLGWLGMSSGVGEAVHAVYLTDAAGGLLLTLGLRAVFKRSAGLRPRPRLVLGAACLLLAATTYSLGYYAMLGVLCPSCRVPQTLLGLVGNIGTALYLLMAWSGGYLGAKLAFQVQAERERALRATAAAHQAQVKALRYQLNPHFLFNALNTVSTLIVERRVADGERMVHALAGFLRDGLDADPEEQVPLSREMDSLRRYLSIEQFRFGERLRVHFDVDPAAAAVRVPSLILQPLVENAIKYAAAARESACTIRVSAFVDGGSLVVRVDDDGPGAERYGASPGGGVGLANVRERLAAAHGDAATFAVGRRTEGGTRAELRLPGGERDR